MSTEHTDQTLFWSLAAEVLELPGVTRSTMMGLPCLRLGSTFFAACDRHTGNLLVKLSEERVDQLLRDGMATPFAPAGRRFRQWAAIAPGDAEPWTTLIEEALQYAAPASP